MEINHHIVIADIQHIYTPTFIMPVSIKFKSLIRDNMKSQKSSIHSAYFHNNDSI